MQLSILAAVAENGVIGRDNKLPWHLSTDLRRFKRLTMDHAIVMGRKTYESIGKTLTGRTMIVISRMARFQPKSDDVVVAGSLDEALGAASTRVPDKDEAFVVGGARIYEMAMPRADLLYMTRVLASTDGDVTFPDVDWQQWQLRGEIEHHEADERNDYPHTFQIWRRN